MCESASCCETHMVHLSAMMPPVNLACPVHAEDTEQDPALSQSEEMPCWASSALPASFWVCEKDGGNNFAVK